MAVLQKTWKTQSPNHDETKAKPGRHGKPRRPNCQRVNVSQVEHVDRDHRNLDAWRTRSEETVPCKSHTMQMGKATLATRAKQTRRPRYASTGSEDSEGKIEHVEPRKKADGHGPKCPDPWRNELMKLRCPSHHLSSPSNGKRVGKRYVLRFLLFPVASCCFNHGSGEGILVLYVLFVKPFLDLMKLTYSKVASPSPSFFPWFLHLNLGGSFHERELVPGLQGLARAVTANRAPCACGLLYEGPASRPIAWQAWISGTLHVNLLHKFFSKAKILSCKESHNQSTNHNYPTMLWIDHGINQWTNLSTIEFQPNNQGKSHGSTLQFLGGEMKANRIEARSQATFRIARIVIDTLVAELRQQQTSRPPMLVSTVQYGRLFKEKQTARKVVNVKDQKKPNCGWMW